MKYLSFRKGHPDSPVGQPGRFQVKSYSYTYSIDNQDADHFCRFSLCFSASARMSRMVFIRIMEIQFVIISPLRVSTQGSVLSILSKFIREQAFHNHLTSQGLNTGVLLLDLERMRNSSEYNFFTTQVLPGWFSFCVTHIFVGLGK